MKRSVQAKYNTQGTFLVSQRLRAEAAGAGQESKGNVFKGLGQPKKHDFSLVQFHFQLQILACDWEVKGEAAH